MRVAHLAFDFRFRHQGRDGVQHDDINSAAANERFHNLQRLLACIRLRDIEVIDIYAEIFGIDRIERMLHVDKRRRTAELLRFSYDMQRNCGFTGGFRPVDLDNSAPGQTIDPKGDIQLQAARRDDGDFHIGGMIAQPHDGAFAELLLNLRERAV